MTRPVVRRLPYFSLMLPSWATPRRKIKRLLRRHNYRPPLPADAGGGGDSLNYYTAIVLDQAKALWRYWPDTEEGRLFQ